jgi:protein-L-isoaspartate O-methyltransferase
VTVREFYAEEIEATCGLRIEVRHGDGSCHGGPFGAVVVNAGTTHARASWLDALVPNGRLVMLLTVAMPPGSPIGKGMVLLVTNETDSASRGRETRWDVSTLLALDSSPKVSIDLR